MSFGGSQNHPNATYIQAATRAFVGEFFKSSQIRNILGLLQKATVGPGASSAQYFASAQQLAGSTSYGSTARTVAQAIKYGGISQVQQDAMRRSLAAYHRVDARAGRARREARKAFKEWDHINRQFQAGNFSKKVNMQSLYQSRLLYVDRKLRYDTVRRLRSQAHANLRASGSAGLTMAGRSAAAGESALAGVSAGLAGVGTVALLYKTYKALDRLAEDQHAFVQKMGAYSGAGVNAKIIGVMGDFQRKQSLSAMTGPSMISYEIARKNAKDNWLWLDALTGNAGLNFGTWWHNMSGGIGKSIHDSLTGGTPPPPPPPPPGSRKLKVVLPPGFLASGRTGQFGLPAKGGGTIDTGISAWFNRQTGGMFDPWRDASNVIESIKKSQEIGYASMHNDIDQAMKANFPETWDKIKKIAAENGITTYKEFRDFSDSAAKTLLGVVGGAMIGGAIGGRLGGGIGGRIGAGLGGTTGTILGASAGAAVANIETIKKKIGEEIKKNEARDAAEWALQKEHERRIFLGLPRADIMQPRNTFEAMVKGLMLQGNHPISIGDRGFPHRFARGPRLPGGGHGQEHFSALENLDKESKQKFINLQRELDIKSINFAKKSNRWINDPGHIPISPTLRALQFNVLPEVEQRELKSMKMDVIKARQEFFEAKASRDEFLKQHGIGINMSGPINGRRVRNPHNPIHQPAIPRRKPPVQVPDWWNDL